MRFRVLRLLVFLIVLGSVSAVAQINPPKISKELIVDQQLSGVELHSIVPIRVVDEFDHATNTGFNAVAGTNRFRLRYTPAAGYTGVDRAVYECTETLMGAKTYIVVELRVGTSVVTTVDDYLSIPANSGSVAIDVLANDFASEGALTISHVELISGGSVAMNGNQVTFTPAQDFTGTAKFAYVAKDSKGTSKTGSALINVVSPTIENDLVNYTQVSSAPFVITMPADGYVLADGQASVFGTLESVSSFTYRYTPTLYSDGFETLRFVNSTTGKERVVEIQLIKDTDVQNALVDDMVYVSKGGSVTFNAQENDYLESGVVVAHSDELTLVSGAFYYTGDNQFEGVKKLYYTVHDGQRSHTANIYVHVGDYMPQVTSYDFVTFKGTPLVLDYDVPIDNYSFKVVNAPSNGTILVNQSSVANGGCNTATGQQLISYTPNSGFTGADAFELEYCVTDGACRRVQASINVMDSDASCHCVGSDCVWAGDANGDGVVNMADLLAVGYHYGESGVARNELNVWGANAAQDWDRTQLSGQNVKKVDANGDGTVSSADTAAIIENYGKHDNLMATNVLVDKTIPVSFAVDNPNPKPGDVVTIQIKLGTETNPVVDLHGWASSLLLPPTDSVASVSFQPNGKWMGKGSPVLSLVHTPTPNTIDLGMARTGNRGISGAGIGGELRITILQSIDPVRPADDEIPLELIFPASIMTDGSGQQYQVEGGKVTLIYQLGETYEDDKKIIGDQIDVLAYPNPTSGAFTLHANNRDVITSVAVYDMLGKEMYRRSSIGSNEHVINERFAEGFYFAHVTTQKGKTVKRIEVLR